MSGWLDKYEDGGKMQEHQANFNNSVVKIPDGFVGQGETMPNWKSPAWKGQFQYGGILDTKEFNPIPGSKGNDEYKGQEANSYWTDEKTLPRNLRNRAKIGRRPSPQEEQQINQSKEYVGSDPKTESDVYRINGELIRKYAYPDFNDGGNDHAYPNFVPKGEVWLDKDNVGQDGKTTLAHELLEREKMMGGMFYDKYGKDGKEAGAHVQALKFENEIRNGKAEVPQLINNQTQSPDQQLQPLSQPQMKNGGWLEKYENGGEMSYYQNGLDFKPRTISQNGSITPPSIKEASQNEFKSPENINSLMNISDPLITPQFDKDGLPLYNVNDVHNTLLEAVSPMINLQDNRKIQQTTGKPLPSTDRVSRNIPSYGVRQLLDRSINKGLNREDAWNVLGIALQESGFGQEANGDINIGHVKLHNENDDDPFTDLVNTYKDKMQLATDVGYTNPLRRLQVYNGDKKLYRNTEQNYYGHTNDKYYGVPIPPEGIDVKKNPLFGKQITDLKENVLKRNPDLYDIMEEYYPSSSDKHPAKQSTNQDQYDQGGVVKDNMGYWNPMNRGRVVEIDSPNITMRNITEPLLGISDSGDKQMMYPGNDYKFIGKKVREYPIAQKGGKYPSTRYGINELHQLQDFTNKPSSKNWLNKYNS
jgi:hypothetical protein